MDIFYHFSHPENRESILRHGLLDHNPKYIFLNWRYRNEFYMPIWKLQLIKMYRKFKKDRWSQKRGYQRNLTCAELAANSPRGVYVLDHIPDGESWFAYKDVWEVSVSIEYLIEDKPWNESSAMQKAWYYPGTISKDCIRLVQPYENQISETKTA